MIDCLDADLLVPFWAAALGYRLADSFDQFRILLPEVGQPPGPVVALQQVRESRLGKNRMHVDLHPRDADAHIVRLQRLGASTVGGRVEEYGTWWQVMADPEGNEFCIVAGADGPEQGSAASG